jgi:hypothetical protein
MSWLAAASGSLTQSVVLSVIVAFLMVPFSIILPRLVAHVSFKSKNVQAKQQMRVKYDAVRKSWRQQRLGLRNVVATSRRIQPASMLPFVLQRAAMRVSKEQHWALLLSLCFVQGCVGFFAASYGAFLAASGSNRSMTLLPLILGGSIVAVLTKQAFVSVNTMRWTLAAALLCMSVLVEAGCAFVMFWLHLPDARHLFIVVGSFQLLSTLLALGFAWFIRWHQHASRKASEHASARLLLLQDVVTAAVTGSGDSQAHLHSAARTIVRAFKYHHDNIQRTRRRDFEAWSAAVLERRILQVLTYTLLTLFGVILALFNLVYGAIFTNEQDATWITRVISSILISASYAMLGLVNASQWRVCMCVYVCVCVCVCVCLCCAVLVADAILIEPARLLIMTIGITLRDLFKQVTVEDLVFSSFRHVHGGYVREYQLATEVLKQFHTGDTGKATAAPAAKLFQAVYRTFEPFDTHDETTREQKLDDVVAVDAQLAPRYVDLLLLP